MNVSIPKKLEKYIRDRVKSGEYGNASEVVREAIRLAMERQLQTQALREKVDAGLSDIKAGRVTVYKSGEKAKFTRDMKSELAARRTARRKGAA